MEKIRFFICFLFVVFLATACTSSIGRFEDIEPMEETEDEHIVEIDYMNIEQLKEYAKYMYQFNEETYQVLIKINNLSVSNNQNKDDILHQINIISQKIINKYEGR